MERTPQPGEEARLEREAAGIRSENRELLELARGIKTSIENSSASAPEATVSTTPPPPAPEAAPVVASAATPEVTTPPPAAAVATPEPTTPEVIPAPASPTPTAATGRVLSGPISGAPKSRTSDARK